MDFAAALERWHDFYVLVGTAGATLVALLFVAVSLGAGFLDEKRTAPTRAFISPVVVHFTAVFFIAAVGLMPGHSARSLALLTGITALMGLAVSSSTTVALLRNRWTDYVRDHVAYGVLPAVCYLALLAAAATIFRSAEISLDMLAGVLLLLLIINIRNAWDLVLEMARRQTEQKTRKR